jgi:branched-chain amino acid transport system substrate-binding protein
MFKVKSSRILKLFSAAALLSASMIGSVQADTIKVGVLAIFSGPFAVWGKQFKEAVDAYQAINGKTAGGHTIEFIWKDVGGAKPEVAKSLAQELIINDKVNVLAGFVLTPNALAVAPLIQEVKIPTVIFNAATPIVTRKSDYFLRTSFTSAQNARPAAEYAATKMGAKTAVIAVSDYAPGIDQLSHFKAGFEAKGGQIVDEIRMPLNTTDFAPFLQRILAKKPDALLAFLPVGAPSFAFVKGFNDNGLGKAGIKFIGTGEMDENDLQALGDAALGFNTFYHYSGAHDSDLNRKMTAKIQEANKTSVTNLSTVGAYDGTHIIYEMVKAGNGDVKKGFEAVKNLAWESPRGPVRMDPETRSIIQNVYLRRVERDAKSGLLINKEVENLGMFNDSGQPAPGK